MAQRDTETHTAPVLGGPLSFLPMSQRLSWESQEREVPSANSASSVLAHRTGSQFSRRPDLWLLPPMEGLFGGSVVLSPELDITGDSSAGVRECFCFLPDSGLCTPSPWAPRFPAPAWRSPGSQLGGGEVPC